MKGWCSGCVSTAKSQSHDHHKQSGWLQGERTGQAELKSEHYLTQKGPGKLGLREEQQKVGRMTRVVCKDWKSKEGTGCQGS